MSPYHRRKLLPLCVAAALSGPAAAIGVGDVQLQSYLGAPLVAEVPLNHLGDLTPDQLKVQVGSQADYRALGVDYAYNHAQLMIEPIIRNGQGYVRITTRDPVREPYLDFVLNVRWPNGQVVREFTVLLDPMPEAQQAAVQRPAVVPVVASVPAQSAQHAATTASHPHRVGQRAPDGAYLTQRGDSLWRIADRMRPAGVPVQQMMNALYAANPHAFVHGNPSRLMEAVALQSPSAEQIAAAGTGVLPAPTAVPQPALAAADQAPVTAPAVASTAVSAAPVASADLQQENAELKSQVADLTKNVAALNGQLAQSEQRMHQLEGQLNELLQQFQQQRATVAALSGASVEAHAGGSVVSASGSMISPVNAAELTPPPKAHTPWWVHLLYWLGIGGVSLLAIREHFWPRRLATAGAEIADSPPLERIAAPEPIGGAWNSPAENARYWHHEEVGYHEEVAIDAEPVADEVPELTSVGDQDPVDASISAGVFIAFGRYDEAARLLQQALAHAPERTDLKLQLLDVYAQADQRAEFDALAADIEQSTDSPEVIAELAVLRENYAGRH